MIANDKDAFRELTAQLHNARILLEGLFEASLQITVLELKAVADLVQVSHQILHVTQAGGNHCLLPGQVVVLAKAESMFHTHFPDIAIENV